MNIAQGMNTVIEESQNSPASDGLGVIIIIIAIFALYHLFFKDKW